jgi:CheY-like chemotaxis protein
MAQMGPESPRARANGADGHEIANVRRLRPLRVLLAMRDRRFMRVTCFLLERRGYDVAQEGGAAVVQAASRFRADVVVFEADLSRGSSARMVAGLAALPAPPGVVTITADAEALGFAGATAIEKWTSVDDLAREIDAASLRRGAQLERRTSGS